VFASNEVILFVFSPVKFLANGALVKCPFLMICHCRAATIPNDFQPQQAGERIQPSNSKWRSPRFRVFLQKMLWIEGLLATSGSKQAAFPQRAGHAVQTNVICSIFLDWPSAATIDRFTGSGVDSGALVSLPQHRHTNCADI
jgi:hypothetical protein